MICKHCYKPIERIYPMSPEEGYVHIEDVLPNYQYCRIGGTWAEPIEESAEHRQNVPKIMKAKWLQDRVERYGSSHMSDEI